ncbi:MAG: hypothetical protein JW781_08115 [Deltaproteobacteria bacterium]|nr:hypothetical protein [Candidatus Anaeroferrophillacea bacterium]
MATEARGAGGDDAARMAAANIRLPNPTVPVPAGSGRTNNDAPDEQRRRDE